MTAGEMEQARSQRPVEFATPRLPSLSDCYFYHRMTLPDAGEVGEEWDLRPNADAYLGHTEFKGNRVLEIIEEIEQRAPGSPPHPEE